MCVSLSVHETITHTEFLEKGRVRIWSDNSFLRGARASAGSSLSLSLSLSLVAVVVDYCKCSNKATTIACRKRQNCPYVTLREREEDEPEEHTTGEKNGQFLSEEPSLSAKVSGRGRVLSLMIGNHKAEKKLLLVCVCAQLVYGGPVIMIMTPYFDLLAPDIFLTVTP